METLTEFFRELAQENEITLKKSTKHYKSADRMLKRQLNRGDKVYAKEHMAEKKREFEQMRFCLKSIAYFKKMMVASKDLLMPQPTTDRARLYVGGDGHPRICKEFGFPTKDGLQTNRVRISSLLCPVEWSMKQKVSFMEWPTVRYLARPKRSLAIPYELIQWMVRSADWWSAITFCQISADMAYSLIEMNVGNHAGVDGHRNVVCGCAYDSKVLKFAVSTSRPHLQSWIRTIDLLRPIVLLSNTIYVPVARHVRNYKETHFYLSSIISLSGHYSRTYDRGPRRFHKCAAHSIYLADGEPTRVSWE